MESLRKLAVAVSPASMALSARHYASRTALVPFGRPVLISGVSRHQPEPMTAPESNCVRTLNTATHTLDGALLQPVLRLFQVRQGASIRLAGIRPGLKPSQAVAQHRKQCLVGNAIHSVAVRVDRTILKAQVRRHCLAAFDDVGVVRAAVTRFVQHGNGQRVIAGVDLVFVQFAHRCFLFSVAGLRWVAG